MPIKQSSFFKRRIREKETHDTTRREKFLAEMKQVVPWSELDEVTAPVYPTGRRGRPKIGLSRMLRVYFIQRWYGASNAAV